MDLWSSSDSGLFSGAVCFLFAACPAVVLALQFVTAPYGRHVRAGWGFSLPPALGWFLMESPTIWLTLLLLPHGRNRSHSLAISIISPYLFHYFNRTVLYPLRLRRSGGSGRNESRNLPFSIAAWSFCFNVLNAYAQTRSATHYAEYPPAGEISLWIWGRVAAGLSLFAWGMVVNVSSDKALLRLKKEGGGGYKVPKGGWFDLVACPNYMGEAAEWLGYAVAAATPAALGFFLFTCANLFPRAWAHRRWYLEKFGPSFPASRKAVLPYLF